MNSGASGTVSERYKSHNVLAVILIVIIGVSATVLGVNSNLGPAWTVGLSATSTVAGAVLGNVLRLDLSEGVVRNQARPATRHLFDQIARLRSLVLKVERYGTVVREGEVPRDRISDWFENLGDDLRVELEASATSVDNWSDLATDVRLAEWQRYLTRERQLPGGEA